MRLGVVLCLAAVLGSACATASADGDASVATGVLSDVASTATTGIAIPVPTDDEPVEPTGFPVVQLDWYDDGEVQTLEVYLADDRGRRLRGLMGVTSLSEFDGMVFVWDSPHEGGFWMKDTIIPLDIAFVGADGLVTAVMTMQPCFEESCPSVGPDEAYMFAFESPAGVLDIEVGDAMSVESSSR